jgi:hypothetical protein
MFRRNTLLEYGDIKWIVSTVGRWIPSRDNKPHNIGPDRYYETMAFLAKLADPKFGKLYCADVQYEIPFESKWYVTKPYADPEANQMHEQVVEELMEKICIY